MKKLIVFLLCAFVATGLHAQKGKEKKQGNAPHNKQASSNQKTNQNAKVSQNSNSSANHGNIWDGTKEGPKPSKNQPAKVRAAFQRDYPTATNVRWSKYRGDWTATFQNGLITSTAVYHANGDRRDTRTLVTAKSLPAIILEEIMKKSPAAQIGVAVKIDVPNMVRDIFRIKTVQMGVPQYQFFDADGKEVKYDY